MSPISCRYSFEATLALHEYRVRMALIQHREPAIPLPSKSSASQPPEMVTANVLRQLGRTYETNTKKHDLPRSPRRYFAGAAKQAKRQIYDRQRYIAKTRAAYSAEDWLPYDEAYPS